MIISENRYDIDATLKRVTAIVLVKHKFALCLKGEDENCIRVAS